jgi:MFS transporter, Spinster family, sphingosine-1-phosphate transporter
MLLAAPLMWLTVHVQSAAAIYAIIFFAQILLFLNNGPINAALVSCSRPLLRALTMGLNVLIIHSLGDAISPPIIGLIGQETSLGRAIELNAAPVLLGGIVLAVGGAWLGRRGTPAPSPSAV